MNTTATDPYVRSFSTGYQRTSVQRADQGIRWERRPGTDYDGGYPAVPADFAARLAAASDDTVRFIVPARSSRSGAVWNVFGTRVMSEMLLNQAEPMPHTLDVIGHLGQCLRHLHTQAPDDSAIYGPPARLVRTGTWLHEGRGPRASAGWHFLLGKYLGTRRWQKLSEWVAEYCAAAAGADVPVLHGWMSLGSVVLADGNAGIEPAATVLSGLEFARGAPEIDVACTAGELIEFAYLARYAGGSTEHVAAALDAFLDGYGPSVDPDLLAIGATIRILMHSHDFATYVGWRPDLHRYASMIADLLDKDGYRRTDQSQES
jgi:hypothetical protein